MFYTGQKVVCADDSNHPDWGNGGLVKDAIYTVRWYGKRNTDPGPGIMTEEITGWLHPGLNIEFSFRASRFRPLVEKSTNIAVFESLLNPSPKTVKEFEKEDA